MSIPSAITEYAFSGSLCRVRKFETSDGLARYCLTIFSLSDCKHLHFPHEEYKSLTRKLYALLSTQAIMPTANKSDEQKFNESTLTIRQKVLAPEGHLKIKFGRYSLSIGPVTAIGLVKTTPFTNIDVFSINKEPFTCDSKWNICTCQACPVFKRLIDFEINALDLFSHRKVENVIFF